MENTTPNFGIKSGVLKRLYDINNIYQSKHDKHDKILQIVYHAILDYYNWHKEKNIKIACPFMEEYLKKYEYLKKDFNTKKIGGIRTLTKKKFLI